MSDCIVSAITEEECTATTINNEVVAGTCRDMILFLHIDSLSEISYHDNFVSGGIIIATEQECGFYCSLDG